MKTILKVVLLVMVMVIALKLLPFVLGLGGLLVAAVLGFIALGVSAVATVFGVVIVLAAVSSPIWVPVLVVLGLVALLKRRNASSPTLVP